MTEVYAGTLRLDVQAVLADDDHGVVLTRERGETAGQAVSWAGTPHLDVPGFEDVTIAEIAQAADVDKKTVFNYFAAKEDLYFDQDQAMETGLVAAVRERS